MMTKLAENDIEFENWHYKNDPTHIVFFTKATWRFWAQKNNAELDFVADDALILRKLV